MTVHGHFFITSVIGADTIEVSCDEPTARVLLPLLQKIGDGNNTGCRDNRSGQWIACFLTKRFEADAHGARYLYDDGFTGDSLVTGTTRQHERAAYLHHTSAAVHCFPVWAGGWRSLVRDEVFWAPS